MIKKIILLLFLIVFYIILIDHKIKSAYISKIDLNLDNDEIGIVINDKSNFFLIRRNEENTLLLFDTESEKNIEQTMQVFQPGIINNLISNTNLNIRYEKKYNIDNAKLTYINTKQKQNIIEVNLYDYKLCIYNNGDNQNMSDCTFIYFNDVNDNKINISDNNKVVFYHNNINEKIKEELYTKWIDIYSLDDSNYTVLKIKKDNYNIINIPK